MPAALYRNIIKVDYGVNIQKILLIQMVLHFGCPQICMPDKECMHMLFNDI